MVRAHLDGAPQVDEVGAVDAMEAVRRPAPFDLAERVALEEASLIGHEAHVVAARLDVQDRRAAK